MRKSSSSLSSNPDRFKYPSNQLINFHFINSYILHFFFLLLPSSSFFASNAFCYTQPAPVIVSLHLCHLSLTSFYFIYFWPVLASRVSTYYLDLSKRILFVSQLPKSTMTDGFRELIFFPEPKRLLTLADVRTACTLGCFLVDS